jgi:hypothetical protein
LALFYFSGFYLFLFINFVIEIAADVS